MCYHLAKKKTTKTRGKNPKARQDTKTRQDKTRQGQDNTGLDKARHHQDKTHQAKLPQKTAHLAVKKKEVRKPGLSWMFCVFLSSLALPCLIFVLSCLVLACLVLSCFCFVLSCLVCSYPVVSCPFRLALPAFAK